MVKNAFLTEEPKYGTPLQMRVNRHTPIFVSSKLQLGGQERGLLSSVAQERGARRVSSMLKNDPPQFA